MTRFLLPPEVRSLIEARNALKARFAATSLRFTLDGNLVGDLGEAVALELFHLKLVSRNQQGIDGHAPDGRTVQVKASGTGSGAAFRPCEMRAEHLLVLEFNYEECSGEVIYNGPENKVVAEVQFP